ncbi:hypothetical protein JAAARDRAFT_42757 [Jaapia argillacea MUCL 33604]|uniref:Uncharacterized protein n=1 Tax=Jaapia argillacea MUCL 33604 TaxID=933084 RepID=A0A067PEY5_9AGAM|nr:hypothetical protein JAAARDRAFT_42757 [Jaapia argillacea MUCL 33604]
MTVQWESWRQESARVIVQPRIEDTPENLLSAEWPLVRRVGGSYTHVSWSESRSERFHAGVSAH